MNGTITNSDRRAAARALRDCATRQLLAGVLDDDFEGDRLDMIADRLEAESALVEYAEELAKVHRIVLSDAVHTHWEDLDTPGRDLSIAAMRAVLDQIAADGRLLPDGGTDLLPCERCNGSGSEPATSPAVSVPDSGPDGTPEKPWPTRADVPERVKAVRDRTGQCWRRYPTIGWHCDFLGHQGLAMDDFAPFVRVDGDKKEGNA